MLLGCSNAHNASSDGGDLPPADGRLFTRLPASLTGIDFANELRETRELNVFTYRNYYNGGGVALGDLTGDSLPEIVLTSNVEGPRLYLNAGAFRFRDATKDAGLKTGPQSWTTGVVLADVNGDGLLDIYLCRAGTAQPVRRANELWIHQGIDNGVPRFREMAETYGIADQGFSTHAAFLDYDRDADLDLFIINNSPRPVSSFGTRNTRHVRDPYGGHKLYRNDGGRFTDVSSSAGIYGSEIGFGLGVGVGDVNRDGWPDIYVANDFFERDYLFVNRGNGTFEESLADRTAQVTYFSMGLDIGDVDNDGWPEVYTTDMLPEDELRLKTMAMFEGWDVYQAKIRDGYHHQFMRNMLQRNNRDGTFSDVGQMAGIAQTDWSWSALIADLDLDGLKDIFVTNGIARDVTSQDYIAFLANEETMKSVTNDGRSRVDFERLTKAMGSTPLPDYAFRNTGDLRFTNEAARWGLADSAFSSGAAYGDLDGDGALDLVVNNVNREAFVYRNNARTILPGNHFVRVRLEGEGKNRHAIGARVAVHADGTEIMQEQSPSRGFQSSVDYVLVFGLGPQKKVDSIVVDWPDGKRTARRDVNPNESIILRQTEGASTPPPRETGTPLLEDVTARIAFDFTHRENDFVDFDRERLIPKMISTEGPALAVADVNRDGLDDLFIGGAKEQGGRLFVQGASGAFTASNTALFEQDAISEDVGAVFFDADGDRDADLYVVSGGSEYSDGAPALQDRLYINDGRGGFRKAEASVPTEANSGSRAVAADFDGDGDIDLFVGGRVVLWRYGTDPTSMLLQNDGRGRFTDVTESVAPELSKIGMVTDAVWRDVDADGRLDLIVVGEWMPVTVFRNSGRSLTRLDVAGLAKSHGWWNRIVAQDFTGDGKVDFIVGNLGLNSRLAASENEPATMYVKDFDRNGFAEQILATYNKGKSYPFALRDDLIKAIPPLKARFLNYKDYASRTIAEVFPNADLSDATVKQAYTFATTLVRNDGNGTFTLVPLPREVQIAPVYGIVADDVDADGRTDLLLAGNFDGMKSDIGRLGAGYGLLLRGEGSGKFSPVPATTSGVRIPGEVRDIQRVRTRSGTLYAIARNDDRPVFYRQRPGARTLATVHQR